MNIPEVRIRASFLLNGAVIPLLLPGLKETGDEIAATDEYISETVDRYNKSWSRYETKILTAMCEVLDLEFKQNIIDAYVVPFGHSFSDPMVISTKYKSERFIEVFTHEVAHRLLTDNSKMTSSLDRKILKTWKELFGEDHAWNTLVHIPVHALLEYIFVDVLDEPERLERDIELCKQHPPYADAWTYVQSEGYQNILKKLRHSY
jgi:hypothetical protein